MIEKLSKYAHDAWSGWMKHVFKKGVVNKDGTLTIPKWAVDRWKRQLKTDYKDLSNKEKESDRKEVKKFIKVIDKNEG